MTATLTDFRTEFAEFASEPDDKVNRWLAVALEIHNLRAKATIYLTAHLLALYNTEQANDAVAKVDDRGGIIVEEQFGPKRLKFMQQAKEERDVFYTRTSYGRMFLTLERRATAFSVRVFG